MWEVNDRDINLLSLVDNTVLDQICGHCLGMELVTIRQPRNLGRPACPPPSANLVSRMADASRAAGSSQRGLIGVQQKDPDNQALNTLC